MRLWLCLFLLLNSTPALAESDGVISLFQGTAEEGKTDSAKEAPKEEEESGIFSFLNFGKFGQDTPKPDVSPNKELSLLEQTIKLADSGNVNAQLMLGYSYLYGQNDAPVDYEKAFEYYAKAALQNDNVGLNNLGSLYYSGIGVRRNTAKAAILFEKAAELGNAEAAVNLAFILISGNGVQKNAVAAVDLFEQASASESAAARFMYGYILYTGKKRERNYTQAAILVKKAADAGFDEAQYVVAQMYIKGHGFPQHYGNAVQYLRKAMRQGHIPSMNALAGIYARGDKFKRDPYQAHILYNLASVRGVSGAAESRAKLEEKMKIDEVIQAQTAAEKFKESPSEITTYIRQTYGNNIRSFVDDIK